ncbi:YgiT-type zinc finger domain [uncultured Eubacterium sp.]|nr:YgiT-type zinc finger domain [uncultured Eubacterium sp.]
MCMYCKNDTMKESTTTHVVNYKGCIIVVKNVPCEECEQCGEKFYTDETAGHLEEIVNSAKKLMQEISVIDYAKATYAA